MNSLFLKGSGPLVVGLGISCTIGYGTILYSFSLLSLEIEKAFQWSTQFIFGVYSVGILLTGLAAAKIGRYLDRYGARVPMSIGSFLVALSLMGQATMVSQIEFVIFILLMEVVSILVLYESAFVALTQATGQNARKPISQITLIAGFASTIFWPVIAELLNHTDWRTVYFLMALLHLLCCLPIHWFVLNPDSWKIESTEPTTPSKHLAGTIHDPHTELLIAFAFGLAAFCIVGLQIHIFGLFYQLHISEKLAILAGSLIGPFQVFSRISDMMLSRFLKASDLGLISVGMMTIGVLFAISAGYLSPYAVILFAIFFGMGQGLTNIVRGALPLQYFGESNYGTITGRMNRIRLIMTAIAPVSFAWIMDKIGAIEVMILICILCLLSITCLKLADKRFHQLMASSLADKRKPDSCRRA